MSFSGLDWAILAAYLLLLGAMGIRLLRREDSSEEAYLLDSRRLTLPAFVATTVSTWYGGILGVGEYSFKYGLSNWFVFGVPYYLAALIFALFLAGRVSRSRLLSIPDQLFSVYNRPVSVVGAAVVFIMTVPAAYILMLGILLQLLFGWQLWTGVVIGAMVSTSYVLLGGFRSVIRTDNLQFGLMFGGFAVMVALLLAQFGGWDYLKATLPAAHFQWHGGKSVGYVASWYFIALAALVEPAFYQRCFAAKSPAVARRGLLISILFWFLFDMMTTASGLYARAVLGDGIRGVEAFPLLGDRILPAGIKGLFFVAMAATIQSTIDSYSFIAAGTLGRDVLWRLRAVGGRWGQVALTRMGLAASVALAVTIALAAESVVEIWHKLGSLGTPALLLPLALSYNERLRFRPGWAMANLFAAPAVVGLWFVLRASIEAPSFPLTIQPIFIGLSLSAALLITDHLTRRG